VKQEKRQTQSRRRFLSTLAQRLPLLGVAATTVHRTGWAGQDQQNKVLATVRLADSPALEKAGGFVLLKDTPAGELLIVCTGEGKYAAMSNICPHRKCRVEVKNRELIQCPCHGSTYTIDGTYVRGPSNKSLAQYRAVADNGVITVTGSNPGL
jgi:Rieske Fe-S protein